MEDKNIHTATLSVIIMPSSFRTSLVLYQDDIPDCCFSQITAALKARLHLDGSKDLACMVAAATSQGNILIFYQKQLLKTCQIPFSDCCKILIYHSFQPAVTKEFLVAISFTKGGVVIDLQQSSVVKSWPDAKKIEVKDENLLGYPQLVVHFSDEQDKIVVTQDCNWEVMPMNVPSSTKTESPLGSVVQALENQLKNVHGNLHLLEKQISLRQSIVNRSLTALNDTVMCKTSRMQAPSYTLKMGKECDEVEGKNSSNHIETCGLWQFLEYSSDSWVIGAAYVNTSEKTLCDIQCFFTTAKENAEYRINYYHTDSKASSNNSSPSVGFTMQDLLETSNSFNGTLEHKNSLVVIVTTLIPRFFNTEEEIGTLLLTCKSTNNPKIFQSGLGSVCLNFGDVSSQNMNFNPSTVHDPTLLRRNMLGLLSLLTIEEDAVLTTIFSSAFRSFKKVAQHLNMQYLSHMHCFYSNGVYGHVCILIVDDISPHRVRMKIRALSERKMHWFIRLFKSALSDDCVFTQKTASAKVFQRSFLDTDHLNSALALLSNAEVTNEDEIMMTEEIAGPVDSAIERIRKEFLKKQGQFLGIRKGSSGSIKIAIENYRHFQHSWFV